MLRNELLIPNSHYSKPRAHFSKFLVLCPDIKGNYVKMSWRFVGYDALTLEQNTAVEYGQGFSTGRT
jgi:hypothetical protein